MERIIADKTYLGIELGSTRIKAVVIDESFKTLAEGVYTWENSLKDGYWTYAEEEVLEGLRACYADLKKTYVEKFGKAPATFGAIGVSAMMHGYIAIGGGRILTPFRTWRNTTTAVAAKELSAILNFNIPQRWTAAHLYQAILNGEEHLKGLDHLTTLAGFVHYMLTGEKVVGIGEASGIFPVDGISYDKDKLRLFNDKTSEKGFTKKLEDILPRVLPAGSIAGRLTEDGARLLDADGDLKCGIPLCPPEGDAGTGMVATNSVRCGTGNVSAGTSVFAMVVLDKPLSKAYPEIDVVATPSGEPVAMVHCNNCSADIDAWAEVFSGFSDATGARVDKGKVFETLYSRALCGEDNCGGLVSVNYLSGESVTGFDVGVPLLIRPEHSRLTFDNLARNLLFSAVATLKIGFDILDNEQLNVEKLYGHGGFFKTEKSGQRVMSAALNIPVAVTENADVGGAWGMAVLAAYSKTDRKKPLADFLETEVMRGVKSVVVTPDTKDVNGFGEFMKGYKKGLMLEKEAIKVFFGKE